MADRPCISELNALLFVIVNLSLSEYLLGLFDLTGKSSIFCYYFAYFIYPRI